MGIEIHILYHSNCPFVLGFKNCFYDLNDVYIVTNYCLVDKKNNYKFVKVLDNKTKDLKKKDIDNSLDSYISENNIKNNYTIDVISVKFIKGKKPIIKVI